MALCRIKSPEQLKNQPPGELGKLLGLDRVPEVGHFRKKLKQVLVQEKTDELHTELFRSWLSEMPDMFFYIDGHVRIYHGRSANLSKKFVSRQRLCLSGTTEFWVNDGKGMPLMVITAELNEKLKDAIELAIEDLKKEISLPACNNTPRFTMVFDRESYEPRWFKKLWEDHRVAVLTYRKNVKDKWDDNMFKETEIQMFNSNVTMRLCEMGTLLSTVWFREVRKLTDSGHQTAILTTHPQLQMPQIAERMFSRWTQENYFKYMMANFDFDKMIEYGSVEIDQHRTLPNPKYKQLTEKLTRVRAKKIRLEAKVYSKTDYKDGKPIEEQMPRNMKDTAGWIEQINVLEQEIGEIKEERSKESSRITVAEMDDQKRYNKLKEEGKKYKNAICMLAYRAETALFNIISEYFKGAQNNGRMLIKEIFSSDADMIPNYQTNTLTIVLHSMSTPRANKAVEKLCKELNETETIYPYTQLKMVFKSIAS